MSFPGTERLGIFSPRAFPSAEPVTLCFRATVTLRPGHLRTQRPAATVGSEDEPRGLREQPSPRASPRERQDGENRVRHSHPRNFRGRPPLGDWDKRHLLRCYEKSKAT